MYLFSTYDFQDGGSKTTPMEGVVCRNPNFFCRGFEACWWRFCHWFFKFPQKKCVTVSCGDPENYRKLTKLTVPVDTGLPNKLISQFFDLLKITPLVPLQSLKWSFSEKRRNKEERIHLSEFSLIVNCFVLILLFLPLQQMKQLLPIVVITTNLRRHSNLFPLI